MESSNRAHSKLTPTQAERRFFPGGKLHAQGGAARLAADRWHETRIMVHNGGAGDAAIDDPLQHNASRYFQR